MQSEKAEGTIHIDTYHTDTGEGYDPYGVGGSREIGDIGVWENDSLFVSKPFTGYKTIASGPIRTIFEITYPHGISKMALYMRISERTVQFTRRVGPLSTKFFQAVGLTVGSNILVSVSIYNLVIAIC